MRPMELKQISLIRASTRKLNREKVFFCHDKRFRPVELASPFAWNDDPFEDNNWVAQLQMWRPLDAYFWMFAKARDAAWLEAPCRVIMDWHDFYATNSPGHYVWSDMIVGMRAMKIAWFLALHFSGSCLLPDNFISVCLDLRKSHLEFLLNPAKSFITNHDFIDLHGAMALAQTLPENEGDKVKEYVNRRLNMLLETQFDKFGVHQENSPQYQEYMAFYLKGLQASGWFDHSELPQYAERAALVSQWFKLPDGRLAPIGDTNYLEASDKPKPPCTPPGQEIFSSSGYAVFKPVKLPNQKLGSYLFFMCARHSLTHKHSDDLSLFWHDDEDILIDPGKFAYQSSASRKYAISTRAHNTLEIDGCDEYSRGRPMRPRKPLPIVEYAEKREGFFYAAANMIIPEYDSSHKRMIILNPSRWLLVFDRIFSSRPHTYSFYWHFPPGASIMQSVMGADGCLSSNRSLFIRFHSSGPFSQALHFGQSEPALQGFCSSGYGKLVPCACLSFSAKMAEWHCATIFSLHEPLQIKRLQLGKYELKGEKENFIFTPWKIPSSIAW